MSEVRLIDANRLITELWKAMWKYEDETEKQFLESDELDVGDWFSHRIFVQNMSDIDRDVVQNQPTVDAVPVTRCEQCKWCEYPAHNSTGYACKLFDRCVKWDWFCADGERRTDGID